jgi:hypothetical protein
MFRHLLQGWGHEIVDLLMHSRVVVFLYVRCSFSLVEVILSTWNDFLQLITSKYLNKCPNHHIFGRLLMSHKKSPISEVLLELIYWIFLLLFHMFLKLLILNLNVRCVSSFFLLNTHFLSEPYLLSIPISSCISFVAVSLAMPSPTSNCPMCHI